MQICAFFVAFIAFGGTPARDQVGAGPEPSTTPISWEFEFKYLAPRRIEVQVGGGTEVYWYLVYTVTNTSAATQRFFPTMQLVTEELKVIDTDSGISPTVFAAIKERHKLTHPYLVHPTEAIGDLASGSDNARESVAIWRATDVTVNNFTIFAAGLSGESKLIKNPGFDKTKPETQTLIDPSGFQREVTVNPRYFTLRKTLELQYRIPGSEGARQTAEPELTRSRWIMR